MFRIAIHPLTTTGGTNIDAPTTAAATRNCTRAFHPAESEQQQREDRKRDDLDSDCGAR